MACRGISLVIVLGLIGCSTTGLSSPADRSAQNHLAVERVVREQFFGAIERFDHAALADAVTSDFEVVEDTLRLDLAGLWALIEPYQGRATISYRFADFRTEVQGYVAWTSYRNFGTMRTQAEQTALEWLETAVLQRSNGRWRIDRLQSTIVRPR